MNDSDDDVPTLDEDILEFVKLFVSDQKEEDEEEDDNEAEILEETYQRVEGEEDLIVSLLANKHALYGHKIWNSSRIISDRIDQGTFHVEGFCLYVFVWYSIYALVTFKV